MDSCNQGCNNNRNHLINHRSGLLMMVFSLVGLPIFFGCNTNGNNSSPHLYEQTALINGLKSLLTPEEIQEYLGLSAPNWEVIENIQIEVGGTQQPIQLLVVSIKHFTHLGDLGELELRLLNDQLMMTTFYPSAFPSYIDRLADTENLSINPQQARRDFKRPPYTRIEIVNTAKFEMRSGTEQSYVSWEDMRLSKQYIDTMVAAEKHRLSTLK